MATKICAARHMSNNRIAIHASKMSHIHENEVTSVICRNIKPGDEKNYDIGLSVIWYFRGACQGIIALQ
jgi:hypothetical protein